MIALKDDMINPESECSAQLIDAEDEAFSIILTLFFLQKDGLYLLRQSRRMVRDK